MQHYFLIASYQPIQAVIEVIPVGFHGQTAIAQF
jgi:hypothetical protein